MSMLKRTLILLGDTPSSLAARQYAFRLAAQSGTSLSGLAGVDLAAIEVPMLGGIGTSAFKVALEEQLKAAGRPSARPDAPILRAGMSRPQHHL